MTWRVAIVIVCCWSLQLALGKKEPDDKTFLEEERKRLEPCEEAHDLNSAVHLRRLGKFEAALPCLVEHTRNNMMSGWAWSNLGDTYMQLGDKPNAKYVFKQAFSRDKGILSFIRRFDWAGPFPIGKLEVDGDPVADRYPDVVSSWRNKSSASFYSELIGGGQTLRWEEVDALADPAGTVRVQPKVDWNDLIQGAGDMSILEWQAWFVAEFAVNRDATYVVRCMGVNTIWINNRMVNGDIYQREQFWFSIPLTSGMHLFRVKLRTKQQIGMFRCEFAAQDGNTMAIHQPHFVPELLSQHALNGFLAVPIFNRNDKTWLNPKDFRITVPGQSKDIPLLASIAEDVKQFPIAPGQLSTVILKLTNKQDIGGDLNACPTPKGGELDTFLYYRIRIAISGVGKTHETQLKVRCRNYTNSFLFSFIDHDGSVQHAAAVAPRNDCPPSGCPVMVTLHGTGVQPGNQADSYKRLEDGQIKYGLDTVWTLAPTRHGAHNWEGPGALTALAALRALGELTEANAWIPHKADVNRVVYAGHSMGGHGCWHLSTHFPDTALAVSTAAGWNSKEEYADSNLFFRHDISASFVDPSVKSVLEACIAENEADRHVSNLKGVPILARVGELDKTVHPYFLRRMRRVLEGAGVAVNYSEIPGKDHWWWDSKTPNDGGVTSDEEVRLFLTNATTPIAPAVCKSKSKKGCDAATSRYRRDFYLTEKMRARGTFVLTCVNPAFQGSVRGVSVLQQHIPFRQSIVRITLQHGAASLVTSNVRRMTLEETTIAPVQWASRKVTVDGGDISAFVKSISSKNKLQICRLSLSDKWTQCNADDTERLAATMGPARRVAEKPFLVVAGTGGSAEENAALYQSALYIANLFFLTSDARAPVVVDKKLSADVAAAHNLIIIGGPQFNSHAAAALSGVPLSADKKGMKLRDCSFRDKASGAVVLAPHGRDRLALVLLGNSLDGVLNAATLATPTIPPMTRSPFSNLVPDFVVTGPRLVSHGPAGYLCAGFWGNTWNFQPELASCYC